MEKLYDVASSAEKLGGISPWTVRAWLSQGRLRPTKIGRRTMISEAELERFVRAEQTAGHPAETQKGLTEL